jgi:hypothetical protein
MWTISEIKLALRKTRVQKIVIIAFKLNVAGFCAVKKRAGKLRFGELLRRDVSLLHSLCGRRN